MQFDAATIEQMVQDVLKQLQPVSAPASPPILPAVSVMTTESKPTVPPGAEARADTPNARPQVNLTDRIITADLLKEKISPASQVLIGSKSIITPAAQDFLRLNRITWQRSGTATSSAGLPTPTWQILINSVNESVKKAVAGTWQQRAHVKQELVGTATEAATAVLTAISRAEIKGIIVVTTAAHAVACRVNRHQAVRAAVVTDLRSWSTAETTLQPNVACVDPTERSFMELQNILNRIVSKPAAGPPAGWEEI